MKAKPEQITYKDVIQTEQSIVLLRRCLIVVRPKPELTPSQFAESHIEIPEGNARPGPVNFENAPYQREPLDMCARDDVYMVTLMWGAQTGKTSLFTMAMSYFIYMARSIIMCQPSQGDLKTWLATKFETMVETCKLVKNRIAKPRSREGVNNQSMKSFLGGFLMFAWAGSALTARGRSAPIIITDEEDGYERTNEGDFGQLLWNRARTFGYLRKWIRSSTPTTKGYSSIDAAYHRGDQREWYVKCPHCGEIQVMKWPGVQWEEDKDGEVIPETVGYLCEHCGVLWNDVDRIAATRKGVWIAKKKFSGHVSYHLPTLPSTMVRLVDLVRDYIDCKRKGDMQTFTNTILALVHEEVEDSVSASDLAGRDQKYLSTVPKDVIFLTAGVDVQHNRIEIEVVGWGVNFESWSIDYKVIYGDTSLEEGTNDSPWNEFTAYWQAPFHDFLDQPMTYRGIAVDSGDGTRKDVILKYCHKYRGRKVCAVKGVGGWNKSIVSKPTEVSYGKKLQRKTQHWPIAVDVAKYDIMKYLQMKSPGMGGFCHFPDNRSDDYYKGLAESEQLKRYYQAGQVKRRWERDRKLRNEPLDLRVYAYAMARRENPIWPHEKAVLDKRIQSHLDLLLRGSSADALEEDQAKDKNRLLKMLGNKASI